MTYDGLTNQSISYNNLDLIGNITRNDTTLVNYFYLADGTKLSALDGSGAGLVYRGPFVYRKGAGSGNSSLTLESAAFGGGLLTPAGAKLYVTDYLGSIRAVVDGETGDMYKASNYSVFGEESVVLALPQEGNPPQPLATAILPDGETLRDSYTGQEDQGQDFGTCYIDFGARQYNPALRRWMTPDPLSEKYYGISPYAFCNNNPVNFVDPDGKAWYYNGETGEFVAHFEDDDDHIYMLTKEQINNADGDKRTLDSYRSDYNMFGQMALENVLDNTVADAVLLDLFARANTKPGGGSYINESVIVRTDVNLPYVAHTKGKEGITVNPIHVFNGYDTMLFLAHEIGHRLDIATKTISEDKKERERSADAFAKGHWAYDKASEYAKKMIEDHENQH